tara:strand:+ start:484 stop:3516 length:3033 start_codon:yes stop_codon:yes gene_type:complete
MPKIPTFTSQTRPTAEVGSVKSNLQVPLSQTVAGALEPLTNALVNKSIQENDLQNKTQALKLSNEYEIAMQSVDQNIGQDSKLGNNIELATNYRKEQAAINREKFGSQAYNKSVLQAFNNSTVLSDRKAFFRVEKVVQKNIYGNSVIQFNTAKGILYANAFQDPNGKFDRQVLTKDMESLVINTFQNKVEDYVFQDFLSTIPIEIDGFEVDKGLSTNPAATLSKLKNKNEYTNLDQKTRQNFIEKAKRILVPQIATVWENHTVAIKNGIDSKFNMDLAKEVVPPYTLQQMIQDESVLKDQAINTKVILSSPENMTNQVVQGFVDEAFEQFLPKKAIALRDYYLEIAADKKEQLSKDPVQFTLRTDPEISKLADEVSRQTNPDLKSEQQIQLANVFLEKQTNLNVPRSQQKVMPEGMAKDFVAKYSELGFESNSQGRKAMLDSLKFQYGENESKALAQLIDNGLPAGAKYALEFGTEKTFNQFMSFDNPEKVTAIENFLKKKDTSLDDIKILMNSESDFKDLENMIRRNSPFNSSKPLLELESLTNVLSLFAGSLMTGNPNMKAADAAAEAARLFSDNYQVEDTYYLPRRLGDKSLNQRFLDSHVEILDTIKENYLKPFKPVAFGSANPNIPDKELTEKMLFNLKAHGEFRTTGNGEETVYGIVLDGGSFATIKNAEGQELSVGIGDNSKILPGGSGIVIDTSLPTAQQKAQYRGYYNYGDKVKEGSMTLDSEGNPTGSPRFNPTDELTNQLNTTSIGDVTSNVSIFTELKADIPTEEEKLSIEVDTKQKLEDNFYNNKANIKLFKGFESDGDLEKTSIPTQVSYTKLDDNGKKVKDKKGNTIEIKEPFRTIADGHRITKEEEESGMIYDHVFKDKNGVIIPLKQSQIDDIFKRDVKKAINLVNDLSKNSTINLNEINQNAYNILVQIAFQMGSNAKEKTGLAEFQKVLKSVNAGNYTLASQHMLYNFKSKNYEDISGKKTYTKWHKQTQNRAKKLSQLMSEIPNKIIKKK